MEVPDMTAFNRVLLRLEKLEQENQFLKDLVLEQTWLTQKQTLRALGVSEPTLIGLRRLGTLTYRQESRRFFYGVDSVRTYLLGKKIAPSSVNALVITAFRTAQC